MDKTTQEGFAPFFVQKNNIYAVPILHYSVEFAAFVLKAFTKLGPDCVAVELPEIYEKECLHAASRLPDISMVEVRGEANDHALYYCCEPCDPCFEALRIAIETGKSAYCIDLEVANYPLEQNSAMPDSFAARQLGLKEYYRVYLSHATTESKRPNDLDRKREIFMAKRLKELSLCYDKVLFVVGMFHLERILLLLDELKFPIFPKESNKSARLVTLSEEASREVMAQYGFLSFHYEKWRDNFLVDKTCAEPNRYYLLYLLFKEASKKYCEETGNKFAYYNFRNLMKFCCNYALIKGKLLPDLFQILSAAKGCVDHNYAYYVWLLATEYPYLKNIDALPQESLTIEQVWGSSKLLRFHLKEKSRKAFQKRHKKGREVFNFKQPNFYGICSYQPEDLRIEKFGEFLKKRAEQLISDESAKTVPFLTSLEEGIDSKETIRHWYEKKLYVKVKKKSAAAVGSVVMIFEEDTQEKYPWRGSWHGEHAQESDMGFYATAMNSHLIGPGISRCEYGGFMLSYPPRRLTDIWQDSDYDACHSKAEVLLMAAIDYSLQPTIVYVAEKPPRSALKMFASRYGKKIAYLPLHQFSPITLNKLRVFHVLDGYHRRLVADEYIH